MKKYVQVILFFVTTCGAHAQQSPTDMAAQEAAAAALHSATASPTFATPWATYQTYYPAFTGGHSQTQFSCYTAACVQTETDGAGMPTAAQFTAIDSNLASFGASNFQLLSFVFTTDPTNPKITFLYSDVQNSITVKEQVILTLVDGTTGWLINARDNQEMH
jgi:hypothetical protein